MSTEQTFSTSDLRSTAQDYKRDAAHKYKWALGTIASPGREADKPRPRRPSESEFNAKRREVQNRPASFTHGAKGARLTRRHDMLEGTSVAMSSGDDDSAATNSDEYDATPSPPLVDVGVMYSFDAVRGPSQGSQILNVALAKAVERFEEKETVKLVRSEYDMIDSEGQSVALGSTKKSKAKASKASKPAAMPIASVPDADEDYEFV